MDRVAYSREIERLLRQNRVVALLGARQVGKTTLAREIAAKYAKGQGRAVNVFDLENPDDLARLSEPMLALGGLTGLVVLDEIQRRPELFPVLRVLADRPRGARFLLLGSASRDLLRQSSESLAGRIHYLEVTPFSATEVGAGDLDRLWERGGFPRSYLAPTRQASYAWRTQFIQSFVERDIPLLNVAGTPSPVALARFWSMLAHVHGQLLNWSELGRAMGVTDVTVKRYTDLLEGALVVRQLKPWHANISKRQVKAPKLYFKDSGLLHAQLRIGTSEELLRHPSVGASWEGFCLEQIVRVLSPDGRDAYFWRTQQGAELDLLIDRGTRRHGFEFKRTTAPSVTPSMRNALADLDLDSLTVIHGGSTRFALAPRIEAVPVGQMLAHIARL